MPKTLRVVWRCFLISLLITLIESKPNKRQEHPVRISSGCQTPECQSLGQQMTPAMNLKAMPCEDFAQFACGNWRRVNKRPEYLNGPWNARRKWSLDFLERVKQTFERGGKVFSSKGRIAPRAFYYSCEGMKTGPDSVPLLKTVLKEIGCAQDPFEGKFTPKDWELTKAMETMYNNYGFQAFFSWHQIPPNQLPDSVDRISINQIILMGSPKLIGSGINSWRSYMKEYYNEILSALGYELEESDIDAVLSFEVKLINIMKTQEPADPVPLDFKELQSTYPYLKWKQYFREPLKLSPVKNTQSIFVWNTPIFRKLSNLLTKMIKSAKGQRVLARAIAFRFLNYTAPALELGRIRSLYREGNSDTLNWNYYCERVTLEMFTPIMTAILREAEKPALKELTPDVVDLHARTTAEGIFGDIRKEMEELLCTGLMMTTADFRKAVDKMYKVILDLGPENPAHEEIFTEEDATPLNRNAPFIVNFIATLRRNRLFYDARPRNRSRFANPPLEVYQVDAMYHRQGNVFQIPSSNILEPAFNAKFPEYILYGKLGFLFGERLTESFDYSGSNYDAKGGPTSWLLSTKGKYFEIVAAAQRMYVALAGNRPQQHIDDATNIHIADVFAVKAAYMAYKEDTRIVEDQPPLPRPALTRDQWFFVQVAQTLCGNEEEENELAKGLSRIFFLMKNTREFAQAFNCSKETKYGEGVIAPFFFDEPNWDKM